MELDETLPVAFNISTPCISDLSQNSMQSANDSIVCNDTSKRSTPCHGSPCTPNLSEIRNVPPTQSTFILSSNLESSVISNNNTLVSEEMSSDKESPSTILQNLRLKNVDKIIIGHININSIRNKIDMLADIIRGRLDILLISEA